jgi:hypothetical protein
MKWPAGLVVSLIHEHAIIQKNPCPSVSTKESITKKEKPQ